MEGWQPTTALPSGEDDAECVGANRRSVPEDDLPKDPCVLNEGEGMNRNPSLAQLLNNWASVGQGLGDEICHGTKMVIDVSVPRQSEGNDGDRLQSDR